jgi:hypothetical protein
MSASLFIVTGDPRLSGQAAEAVRIAAGIGVWKRNTVALYLGGPAVLALSLHADEWIDGDAFIRYLPMLQNSSHPVYVQLGTPWLKELVEPVLPFREIADAQLAALLNEFQYIARFPS